MRYIGIRDARRLGDFLGYQPARLHKGVEAIHNLAAAQTGGRDFDQLAIAVRQSRGLRIEHDDVVLYQAERTRFSALGERRIALRIAAGVPGNTGGSHLERRTPPRRRSSSGSLEGQLNQLGAQVAEGDAGVTSLVGIEGLGCHAGDVVRLENDRAILCLR